MAVISKCQQVEMMLREAMRLGRWSVGDKLPSEEKLLEEFEVSRTTLRDALNSLANENIIYRKHGSGTYMAKDISTASIAIVATGDIISSNEGFFHRAMMENARKLIESAQYRTIMSMSLGSTYDEMVSSMPIFNGSVMNDIVGILSSTGFALPEHIISKYGIKIVTIDFGLPLGDYSVVIDYAHMTHLAVDLLHMHGYDDFAIMHMDSTGFPSMNIEARMHNELYRLMKNAVNNDESRLIPVKWSSDYSNAYEAFKKWWDQPNRPNAIFFYDDALCDVAIRGIMELGISVPDDLAIITNRNVGRNFNYPVPLTGVGFDPTLVASTAWNMLFNLLNKRPVPEPVIYIPAQIIYGKSLGE